MPHRHCLNGIASTASPPRPHLNGLASTALPQRHSSALPQRHCLNGSASTALPQWQCLNGISLSALPQRHYTSNLPTATATATAPLIIPKALKWLLLAKFPAILSGYAYMYWKAGWKKPPAFTTRRLASIEMFLTIWSSSPTAISQSSNRRVPRATCKP